MQKITGTNVDSAPNKGYSVSKDKKRKDFYQTESHIYKQNALSGIKATAHKCTNNILTYFPKGFAGSKNSDFYEFLSLGMFPYVVGSVGLIAQRTLCNRNYLPKDKSYAKNTAKMAGAGVILYAVGKWASQKLSHSLLHASTGVNLDMLYINKVNELPEPGKEKGIVRTQYPSVFSSVDFYRKDLIEKDSNLNHDDMYWYYDKVAKKAGFKNKLNAPNQIMSPKIRQLITRSRAMDNINRYIVAATGVALGAQKAFGDIKFSSLSSFAKTTKNAFKEGFKSLWKGQNGNVISRHGGKALLIGSVAGTLLSWLIPTIGFKTNKNRMKSTVDTKKEYEVS